MKKKPQCRHCRKKPGRLPKDFPLFCSLRCIYHHIRESHMDWKICEGCNQWHHRSYTCDNCPEPEVVKGSGTFS